MSIGATPIRADEVTAIIDRKMADFSRMSAAPDVRYLAEGHYFDAVLDDPDIRFAVETGYMSDVTSELRDPVATAGSMLLACPQLVLRILEPEPAEIHRLFVEGALMRKLFRFFVPGGEPWETSQRVREIMQRHFSLQLVVTEAVLAS